MTRRQLRRVRVSRNKWRRWQRVARFTKVMAGTWFTQELLDDDMASAKVISDEELSRLIRKYSSPSTAGSLNA